MQPRSMRVLVVQDDVDLARVLTRAFRARHFEAVSASDGNEAVAAATAVSPDYAVLDVKLRDESGLALIRPLLAHNPAMKILVLTGYASIATAVESIKLGACHYMAKPAHIEEVMAAFGIASGDAPDNTRAEVVNRNYSLEELEWRHIAKTLRDCDGNVSAAARMLNMHLRTLQRKIAAKQKLGAASMLANLRGKVPQKRRQAARRRAAPPGDA